MFIAIATRTMQGAKQVVHDEPIKLTPRRDRIAELSRQWQAARPAIEPIPPEKRIPKTEAQQVILEVCQRHGVSYAQVMSKSRSRPIVKARAEAMWALKDWKPSLSLPQIGRMIGGRDHTTVLHALRKRGL